MKVNLKHILPLLMLVLPCHASTQDDSLSRIDRLEQRVASVMSKAGIHFGGRFKSHFLLSRIDSASPGVAHDLKRDESVEYTSVDFDIQARPNDAITGRLIFRMHQDWRNFFSDISNPVFSRWISIDGLVADMFGYNVGDFRERYSPLTLWSPDIEVPYEPEIFARLRRDAMTEEFLGENNRVLQGLNFNFDAEIAPIFRELHFNLLGSRLRTAETSIQNGSAVAAMIETAPMDRYLVGTNLDIMVLPGIAVGGSFLDVFDSKPTFDGSNITRDTLARQTAIVAGRGGMGTALFLDPDRMNFKVNIELAQSMDDTSWYALDSADTDTDGVYDSLVSRDLQSDNITGTAVSVDLAGQVALGSVADLDFGVGFLRNADDFRNQMAQSPSFLGQRIMNIENDAGRDEALYSTFDAMYRHVFKFTPSEQFVSRVDLDTLDWFKAPYRKISYTNAILPREEVLAAGIFDPALQLVMPFGPATPNRAGMRGSLGVSLFEKGIRATASGMSVEEITGMTVFAGRIQADTLAMDTVAQIMPKTSFLELGAGLSVDLAAFIRPLQGPLRLSGGYTHAAADNAGLEGYPLSPYAVTSGFLNAGLYWNFWKRASALLGYQRIETDSDTYLTSATITTVQNHWAVGLEYKVTEGGVVTGSFGKVDVDFADDDASTTGDADPSSSNFDQWQTELFLTVEF
ncbi:MAG: hypothetical protein GF418_07110 [Chitinivibrionales bacterium]|nr:hypothetical protein [Chitinivibrionales bacterium]MBD3395380.1 hypothetical protein [Chitinivibrionales bacterium]